MNMFFFKAIFCSIFFLHDAFTSNTMLFLSGLYAPHSLPYIDQISLIRVREMIQVERKSMFSIIVVNILQY